MMRLVVMGVAAFLLSLGGTTGTLVMRGRAALEAAADSARAHADPTAGPHGSAAAARRGAKATGDSARADSTVAGHTASEDTSAMVASPLPAPEAGTAVGAVPPHSAPTAGANAPSTPAVVPAASRGNAPELSYRQLARIFSNMKTTDAVKVLAYMSDDEVQGVLEALGVRQASGLLAAFPKERAATLSRRLLHASEKPAAQ
jgi:hypothetical protein